jgi:competence ComEA-like helix-hairpin-helix protein
MAWKNQIYKFLRSNKMSIYRRLIVAVAALGLATSVFAADENAPSTTTTTTDSSASAPAATTTETTPGQTAEATKEDATTTTTTTTTSSTDKVDINKATVKELMKVKGLSAAKAKAIVMFRKKHGDFKSVDDLKEVKGFKKLSDKKFQELEDRLTAG